MTLKDELQDNSILASVLISTIGTGALIHLFKLGMGMSVIMFFVIMAIVYMGINMDEDEK